MQLLIILPLFLLTYIKFPNTVSWIIWAGCLGLGVLITSSLATYYGFKVAFIASENYQHDIIMNLLAKPYCRIAAYLLGAYCGAIYFAVKVGETEDVLMRKLIFGLKNFRLGAPISFFLGLATVLFAILIQKEVYDDWGNGFAGWTDAGNESYLGFEHLIYSLGLSFLLLPVLVGEARWVRCVLNLGFWRPLSRLGLCVLFVHVAVARALFAGEQRAYFWQKSALLKDWVIVLMLSYFLGLLVYLLIDAPVRSLLKTYIKN